MCAQTMWFFLRFFIFAEVFWVPILNTLYNYRITGHDGCVCLRGGCHGVWWKSAERTGAVAVEWRPRSPRLKCSISPQAVTVVKKFYKVVQTQRERQ